MLHAQCYPKPKLDIGKKRRRRRGLNIYPSCCLLQMNLSYLAPTYSKFPSVIYLDMTIFFKRFSTAAVADISSVGWGNLFAKAKRTQPRRLWFIQNGKLETSPRSQHTCIHCGASSLSHKRRYMYIAYAEPDFSYSNILRLSDFLILKPGSV